MTIADDMRAASLGELNRVRAQLKTANEEIEQLRRVVMKDQEALTAAEAATLELRRDLEHANHELAQRTHGMFMAQEAGKDLARQLSLATDEIERLRLIAGLAQVSVATVTLTGSDSANPEPQS